MKEKKIQNWYAFIGLILLLAVFFFGSTHKLGFY